MRSETTEELREITEFLSEHVRTCSSPGIRACRKFIKDFLKKNKLNFFTETFEVEKTVPVDGYIVVNRTQLEAYPFVGSPWGEREADAVYEKDDVRGKIALAKVNGRREADKVRELKERGAVGVIFYMEELHSPFIGNIEEGSLPTVSVDRDTAKAIVGKRIKLVSKTKKVKLRGENILFDLGKGPFIYITAHLDTKPFVRGAIDNAVGVALLLMLAKKLKDSYLYPYRLRFMITDCEEMGLEGAKHHVKNLKHAYYVVNIDSVGWKNPAVIYKDAEGYNGEQIMEKFYKHLNDLKIHIPFREGKRGRSDHIPFKRKGVQALFLSSNPFTLRHTFYDIPEAVDWDVVEMWFEVLTSFLRRFPKL